MRTLSIDPGHSTGVAVYNAKGELELSLVVADGAWNGGSFLNKLVNLAQPDTVLLEGIPSKFLDEKTASRFYELERWFTVAGYDLYVIMPSQWKGLAKRVEVPGQHARDAATMAAWWLAQR